MPEREFREELFAQFARIGKAIASPARLEMIYLLSQGQKSVEELAKAAGLSLANASQHLQQLKAARIVWSRKEGQRVRYGLASERVEGLWQSLQRLGEERLLEVTDLVNTYIKDRDGLEPVTRRELLEKMRDRKVVLIDVRPSEEYAAGHLPEALSVPLGELEARLRDLPADREIIAYCRGPYCLLAVEAVERLRAKGFRALRLADGFPEWKAHGLPLEGVASQAS